MAGGCALGEGECPLRDEGSCGGWEDTGCAAAPDGSPLPGAFLLLPLAALVGLWRRAMRADLFDEPSNES